MKVLTLYQPWATLMALGLKKIETRGRKFNYRGPLAIHAAKGKADYSSFMWFKSSGVFDHSVYLRDLPRGAILAIVDLKDCIEIAHDNIPMVPECRFGDYTPGRFMLKTELIKTFKKPIPARGMQGLWNIDDEALRVCRVCGCSQFNACMGDDGPCHWVEKDLCSACQFTVNGIKVGRG